MSGETRSTGAPLAEPQNFLLSEQGFVPNNPTLPVLLYQRAVMAEDAEGTAAVMEALFASNGWPAQ
ncbi:hypothetical protein FV242_33110 [Methylobacterium sp. WL64]|uniref:hypothetical protein n=1 Tax=Methylobacterium sp. WL64 TaxID=2603894 RepID=UPI0011CC46A4|nr:hypothetical protein [Methylobacterium sp. WL64]TXM96774.1 hypothetical protein FV242_33110 [Methylobacterium sp. WL64]